MSAQLSKVDLESLAQSVKDEDKLYRYNGILYPRIVCPEEHLKALVNITAREDDVMLVAYPKCGFNWVTGVLRKIITQATGVESDTKLPPLMEFFGPEARKMMDGAPSPRLVGTHMPPSNIPKSFFEKKAKMLVIFRNPKDTLVSYFHFSNSNPVLPSAQSWDTFCSDFISGDVPWGSYFDHILAWEKRMDDPNVMAVTYEELKQDLTKAVREISTFFGYKLTEAQVQQISEGSTFSAMKKTTFDDPSLEKLIFRKGEVGDWKNHFTPEQSKAMDDAFNKHLAGTRLGAKFNYQVHCQ